MAVRIDWLCHAPTKAMRDAAFPAIDETADEAGIAKAQALAERLPKYDRVVSSPVPAALATVAAMKLDGVAASELRDIGHGSWAGRSMIEVHATEPDLLAAWMADTTTTTPGGEPLAEVIARVGTWMQTQSLTTGRVLAVTHPTVIRVALSIALGCPVESVFNIDIMPLARTTLSFNGKWRLQTLNVDLL